jgi:hypothetical protein
MRWRAVALVACWVFGAGASSAAPEPPLIVAVAKCPPKSACIVVDITVAAKESDRSRIVGSAKSDCGGKIYRVRGRLRSSAVRTYNLAMQGECIVTCADGRAAYFGRTARNAPIIESNLGRFEVVDEGVQVGVTDDIIVLDEAKRAAAKYIGNSARSDDYSVGRTRVYMRRADGACVTAPQERPGLLAIVDARFCPARSTADAPAVDFKDLTDPSQAFLQRWIAPLNRTASEAFRDSIHRLPDGLLVVQINDRCYRSLHFLVP